MPTRWVSRAALKLDRLAGAFTIVTGLSLLHFAQAWPPRAGLWLGFGLAVLVMPPGEDGSRFEFLEAEVTSRTAAVHPPRSRTRPRSGGACPRPARAPSPCPVCNARASQTL